MIDSLERRMIPVPLWKGGPNGPKAFLSERRDGCGWIVLVTIRDELALFVTKKAASQFAEMLQLEAQKMRKRLQEVEADGAWREKALPAKVARADAESRLRENAVDLSGLLTQIGDDARTAGLSPEALTEVLSLPEWYLTNVLKGFSPGIRRAPR